MKDQTYHYHNIVFMVIILVIILVMVIILANGHHAPGHHLHHAQCTSAILTGLQECRRIAAGSTAVQLQLTTGGRRSCNHLLRTYFLRNV